MSELLTPALAILSVVLTLVLADLYHEIPAVCERLLKAAAEKIPTEERRRYTDEWNAELDVLLARRSKLRALIWSYGIYRHASETADVLRSVFVLEGHYEDDLDLFGRTVVVSAGCRIAGTLHCRSADIEGVVLGRVDAWRRVRIRANGVVIGNVCTQLFVLEDGAEFTGRVIEWIASDAAPRD